MEGKAMERGCSQAQNYKAVVHGHIMAALVVVAIIYCCTWWFVPAVSIAGEWHRLIFALKLQAPIALPLLGGIAMAVQARYLDQSLIMGYKSDEPEWFAFMQAFNKNTLEQTVLSSLSILSFCAIVPVAYIKLAIAHVLAFLVGRLMFFVGYRISPMYRLVGFATGYYPAIVSLFMAFLFSVRGMV